MNRLSFFGKEYYQKREKIQLGQRFDDLVIFNRTSLRASITMIIDLSHIQRWPIKFISTVFSSSSSHLIPSHSIPYPYITLAVYKNLSLGIFTWIEFNFIFQMQFVISTINTHCIMCTFNGNSEKIKEKKKKKKEWRQSNCNLARLPIKWRMKNWLAFYRLLARLDSARLAKTLLWALTRPNEFKISIDYACLFRCKYVCNKLPAIKWRVMQGM